ncbi:MAG: translocation/assembly module TamB domain-containing protein [Oceanicaulis sp.]
MLTLLVLLAGLAVLLVSGPLGRDLVRDQLDGREIAGYGALDLGAIEGNVLGGFTLESLALENETGVWLRAETVEIDWNVWALLSRRIEVEAVSAERVALLRVPERGETEGGGGSFDWDIDLADASIETLHIAEGVAGPPADYSVTADFSRLGGDLSGALQAERLDAPGDSIDARFEYADEIELDARIEAAPGGPLATLLRAPELGAAAVVEARGGLDAGSGRAEVDVGGADALRFTADWTETALTAEGRVRPARWPRFEALQTWLGGPADFSLALPLEGGLSEPAVQRAELRLDAPDLTVEARPDPDRADAVTLTLDAAPDGRLAALLRSGGRGVSAQVDFQGALDAGQAQVAADIGGEDALRFTAEWTAQTLEAEGRVRPARWPQFAQSETLLGGPADIALTLPLNGGLTRPELMGARIELQSPQADLTIRPEAEGRYAVNGRIDAPAGGALAELMRAGSQGADARIDLVGGLEKGSGEALVSIGGQPALDLSADWTPQRLEAQGQVRPSRWPGFEQLQTLLGGASDFTLDVPLGGSLREPRLEDAVIRLDAPQARLTVTPLPGEAFAVEARAGSGLVSVASGGAIAADSVEVENGRVDLSGDAWRFSGDVTAEALNLPGEYAVSRIAGPITVTGPINRLAVEGDLSAQGARYDNDAVADVLGASPRLEASIVYEREAQRLTIERARADAAAGPVAGSGVVNIGARRFDVTLSSAAFSIDPLTDQLTGSGAIDLAAEGAFNGVIEFQASASGFNPAGDLAERLSGPIAAEVDGRRTGEGGLEFDRLQVQSPDLVVDAAGAQAGEQFSFEGEAVYSGQSPVAGVSLAGTLEAAFEAQYGPEGVDARIDAAAGQVTAGPVEVSEARLRAEISGPFDALSGEARLTGDSPRGPVDLAADFARERERLRLTDLSGRAGGLTVEGSADVAPGAVTADLDIAPVEGFGALSLQARLDEGELDVTASAEDLIAGDMSYFDRFDFTLQGPLENARFSLIADGAYGAPFDITAEGRIQLAGGPVEVRAELEGEYGQIPIATREPLTVSAADPLTASADLSVGDGRMSLEYRGGEAQRITGRLKAVPAAILSLRRAREPVEGALSGELALSRDEGVWTGRALLQGDDLRPADEALERALDGAVTLDLNTERLEVGVRADGPNFTALADGAIRTGPVTGLGALTAASNPISAEVDVDGRIGPFAAFHLTSGQRLSGDVRIDARVSGTVGAPDLVGDARLQDARFSDSRAGLVLQDLILAATFTQSRAEITELSATDGEGGRLTGDGSVEFAGGLSANARAVFESFQVVDRDDVSAVASGDVAFDLAGGEGSVTGAATIERAEVSPPDSGRPTIPGIEVTEVNVPAGVREPDDGAAGGGPTLALDYQVTAPRRIFVRGSNFDTEWGLEMQVSGTVSDPEIYGAARVVRGRADLLGRVFDIESGLVRLSGDPGDARLQLTAVREERDITARIVVEGPVTSPSIDLRSSPSLPQDEVASRILFGEGAANLTGLQAAQLAASLASLSGGGGFDPLGALRQASGLDQLGVRRDAGGGTVVTGGRYLTEDVYLELESAGSSAAPSTNIEWELTRRFTLLSRLSADGQAGVALSWRTEYDDDPFGGGDLFDFDRLNFFGFGRDAEDEAGDLDAEAAEIDTPQAPRDPDDGVTTLPRSGG